MEKLNKDKILANYFNHAPEDIIELLINKINEVIEQLTQGDTFSESISLEDLFMPKGKVDRRGIGIYEDSEERRGKVEKINLYDKE